MPKPAQHGRDVAASDVAARSRASGDASRGAANGAARRTTRRGLLAALALVAATLLAQLPALRAGWLWDDDVLVLNPLVRAPDGLPAIWAGDAPQEYAPLTTSLYWLEFRLWGASAAGFHAVTLLLHVVVVLALWRLLAALFRAPAGPPAPQATVRAADPAAVPVPVAESAGLASPAWWGALLYGVHPVTVATVAWVAETKTVLAMLFALLATRCWLAWLDGAASRAGARRLLAGSILCCALALLAKSALVMLPCVLLLLAWWRRGAVTRRVLLASAPHLLLSLVLGLLTIEIQHSRTLGAGLAGSESFALRCAAAGQAVWWYLGKALLPLDLTVVYARWPVDAGSVLAWLPLAALLAALIALLRARRPPARAAGLGLAAFALLLLPALGLVEMAYMAISRVSDHFAYPALAVPCALVAAAGARLGRQRRLAVAAALVAVLLGAQSHRRAELYADQATLFADNVARVPDAWLARNNLGAALLVRAEASLARGETGLAREDTVAAEAQLRAAIALHPAYPEPRSNLAALLLDTARAEEARGQLAEALRLAPDLPGAHATLGRLLLQEGRRAEAAAALRRALALDPEQAGTHNVLGVALAQSDAPGAAAAAEQSFRAALALRPDFPEALNNLGRLLLNRAQALPAVAAPGGAAAGAAGRADTPDAAAAAQRQSLLAEAEACLRRALALQSDYAAARDNLAALERLRLNRPR